MIGTKEAGPRISSRSRHSSRSRARSLILQLESINAAHVVAAECERSRGPRSRSCGVDATVEGSAGQQLRGVPEIRGGDRL